jgi:adenine-specific DNA-methyltransferase
MQLSLEEKQFLIQKIASGEVIPDDFQEKLFPTVQKEYELRYAGKMRREDLLADQDGTFAVPLQIEKVFNGDRESFPDGWKNMVVFGDNLQFLKTLFADKDTLVKQKVKGKVNLIYIDPPFATENEFKSNKGNRAYTDKVKGAEFIEFLRRRLLVAKELLADDGVIYVHLDTKKSHYIKIVWKRTSAHSDSKNYGRIHDVILFYKKGSSTTWNKQYMKFSDHYLATHYRYKEADGRRYDTIAMHAAGSGAGTRIFRGKELSAPEGTHWRFIQSTIDDLEKANKLVYGKNEYPRWKKYLDETEGITVQSIFDDIHPVNSGSKEKIDYPTQKPEALIERLIRISTNPGDLVLDFFGGSGSTAAVAEKLDRKWIVCDIGKLSFYTIQKRLLTIENSKDLLGTKKYGKQAKSFITINTGLYDIEKLRTLERTKYVQFVLDLFEVDNKPHKVNGVQLHGYRKDAYSVLVWDYLQEDGAKVDEIYLDNLHRNIGRRIGSRIYIIAPANAVQFIGDFHEINDVRYYFLKIPYQIINELHRQPFSKIRQPQSKTKINDLENAIGFHFMKQPDVECSFEDSSLKITKFKPHASDELTGKSFSNFETLSMLIWDSTYNGKEFTMTDYRFANDFAHIPVEKETDEAIQTKLKGQSQIIVPIPEHGESIFLVFIDIFGNEFKQEIKTI